MGNIEIAVIDNGIKKDLLQKSIRLDIVINDARLVHHEYEDKSNSCVSHGTICALIVEKYCKHSILSSIRMLDEIGIGFVDKLGLVLDICEKNDIRLVNLSLGSTHYKDKTAIQKVINHYANRGMVIVAAAANNGYKAFPAALSNVIGVAAGDKFCVESDIQIHKGIDFLAFSEHEIQIDNELVSLKRCNSYAAPFITAMIGNFIQEKSHKNICEVREQLLLDVFNKEEYICYPDWIEYAWVSTECKRSKIPYSFHEVEENFNVGASLIDTLVLKNRRELAKYIDSGKHIVYLGDEKINQSVRGIHFWSKDQRIKQIEKSVTRVEDINIPVILCKIDEWQDEMLWLCELRTYFGDDGYNVYAASKTIESVLYDMEYIPEKMCNEKHKEQIHNFLYWQTFYNQSDAILFVVKRYDHSEITENTVDVLIDVTGNEEFTVRIYCDGQQKINFEMSEEESEVIHWIYQKTVDILAEGTDE